MITNILDIISLQAFKQPNKVSIYTQKKEITYKQLNENIDKLAFYLNSLGINKNDIIFHHFEDEYLTILAMFATAKLGATLITLPTQISSLKLKELKEETKAKYLLHDIKNSSFSGIDSFFIDYESFEHIKNFQKEYFIDSFATWQIVIGSGTTGKEKLFEVSHDLELERIKISKNSLDLRPSDVVASLIKLNFNSTKIRFLATLYAGASYFIIDNNTIDILQVYKKYKISLLYTSVYHVENILKIITKDEENILSFLRVLSIGGSTISESLKQRVKKHLTSNLYIGYGTNDIGGITITNTDSIFHIEQTVGYVLDGIKVKIVDENDNEKPIGKIGEIKVKSPGMIYGYLNDEKNTNKFFKNGWFYPGDLGKFTKEKQLIYCGRSDYMMIVNGINIYPALIENRLLENEDVEDAACIPIKDTISQDIPVCAVVLKKNATTTTAQLLSFALKKLEFSSPKEIVILEEIPRSTLGKLQREKLKTKIYEELLSYTREFNIKLEKFHITTFKLLDIWLKEVFDITVCETDNTDIYSFSKRAILLIEQFLKIAQLPTFYKGKISSIQEDEKRFFIKLRLEYTSGIVVDYYTRILNSSFQYLYEMINLQPTPQNKQLLINSCVNNLLNPILQNMPVGRNRISLLQEVFKKNIPYIHVGNGIYQLGWGSKGKKIDRSATINDSAMGFTIGSNKIATANILKKAGLPTPIHTVTNQKKEALTLADKLGYPLVVKPLDLDRGEGVSINLFTQEQLLKAFDKAYSLSPSKNVIIEKQVKGVCHRVFIAHGKLLYGVKRLPIGIYADGQNTISTLIDKANKKEQKKYFWEKKDIYFKDEIALELLNKNNLSLESIPQKNLFIPLREIETVQDGGIDEDITNIIHPSNIELALGASKLLELNVAGVDIISEDISKPWYENNAIINELNYAPDLGSGEISKKSIGKYLENYINKDGRIPIELFIGDTKETLQKAQAKYNEYLNKGLKTYYLDSTKTLNEKKQEIYLSHTNFIAKSEALLLDNNVDALIIVDKENIFYKQYSPFDKVTQITIL